MRAAISQSARSRSFASVALLRRVRFGTAVLIEQCFIANHQQAIRSWIMSSLLLIYALGNLPSAHERSCFCRSLLNKHRPHSMMWGLMWTFGCNFSSLPVQWTNWDLRTLSKRLVTSDCNGSCPWPLDGDPVECSRSRFLAAEHDSDTTFLRLLSS